MADKNLAPVLGTAQKLQEYLFSSDIKRKFEMAAPKWLSVDRLLRVVFTSVMKNPKLLNCTTESLMGAIMQCAQLGLEPILGRAHLIPYRNNKKPGNPLECQFQPGYQGLVDLAERSGQIETVKAHVVYENDHFDIEYGLHERLIHKPKMDGARGKPIGAYTVWARKSGVKTYTFMLLDDIYRDFRSKSEAYRYSIKNKRSDTPWIESEPEMLKKSLIKRHSKLEPASIDFMTAVETDNAADIGEHVQLPSFMGPLITAPEDEDTEALLKQFDKAIALKEFHYRNLDTFLSKSAETFDKSIEEIKAEAMKDFDGFWKQFQIWENSQSTDVQRGVSDDDKLRAEFINLRSAGFSTWVHTNLDRIVRASSEIQKELNVKWSKLYSEPFQQPFPVKPGSVHEPPEDAPPIVKGYDIPGTTGEIIDQPVTTEGQAEEERAQMEKNRSRLNYLNAMGTFKTELNLAAYNRVLMVRNYQSMNDVPEEAEDEVLAAMSSELDAQNAS